MWADEIFAGPFGVQAPTAIVKIGEAIEAKLEMATATATRSAAMDRAYQAFLSFKDAVRHAHGSSSPLYQRLRIRSRASVAVAPPPEPPVVSTTPAVSPEGPVALTSPPNGAAH